MMGGHPDRTLPSTQKVGDPDATALASPASATRHLPEKQFQDGLALAKGVGTTVRRTMTIAGTAYSPWQFWVGRKDSQWAQALGPLESPVAHGGNRTQYAQLVAEHYRADYETVFGPLPDLASLPANAGPVQDPAARAAWDRLSTDERDAVNRVFANLGKAIAACERRLMPRPSRFDAYVAAVVRGDTEQTAATLARDEVAGLRLFIGKADCIQCHSGPPFTDNDFHNAGVPAARGLPADSGRLSGARQVLTEDSTA